MSYAVRPGIISQVMGASANASPDSMVRLTTVVFGQTNSPLLSGPFVWQFANSAQDRRNGRICTATGFWGAGSCIVYVDGLPFIDVFAPNKVVKD